jgi:hypothetical protein
MTFPLEQDGRCVRAVAGSRKWAITLDDVLAHVRTLVASIDRRVFMPLPPEPDDDPILAPMLSACGPRVHVPAGIDLAAVAQVQPQMPPCLRSNEVDERSHWVRARAQRLSPQPRDLGIL